MPSSQGHPWASASTWSLAVREWTVSTTQPRFTRHLVTYSQMCSNWQDCLMEWGFNAIMHVKCLTHYWHSLNLVKDYYHWNEIFGLEHAPGKDCSWALVWWNRRMNPRTESGIAKVEIYLRTRFHVGKGKVTHGTDSHVGWGKSSTGVPFPYGL